MTTMIHTRPALGRRVHASLLLGLLAVCGMAAAQADDDVLAWQWHIQPASDEGGLPELVLTADIEPGWIVYASDFEAPEIGPRPAVLKLDAGAAPRASGEVVSVDSREASASNFIGEYRYTYFSGKAEFRQAVRLEAGVSDLAGTISGQTCFEETGLCTLFKQPFVARLR